MMASIRSGQVYYHTNADKSLLIKKVGLTWVDVSWPNRSESIKKRVLVKAIEKGVLVRRDA